MINRVFPVLRIAICALALAGCAKEAPPPQWPAPEVTVITVKPQNIPFTPDLVAQTESSQRSTSWAGCRVFSKWRECMREGMRLMKMVLAVNCQVLLLGNCRSSPGRWY